MIQEDLEMELRPEDTAVGADLIKELVEDFGLNKEVLKKRLGISEFDLERLLNKEVLISSELAERIEQTTGLSAKLLVRMDSNYAKFKAENGSEKSVMFLKPNT